MDKIELLIDKYKITRFQSFSISKNLYEPATSFNFSLKRPEFEIISGSQCQIKINDILQFTGIIDIILRGYDGRSIIYDVSGRNLLGLITDDYCQKFNNYSGIAFKTIIIELLSKVPIIKNLISENKLIIDKSISKLIAVSEDDDWKPSVGESVFDFIKKLCKYHGLIFYIDSNNNLIFDKPRQVGPNEFFFQVTRDGNGNFTGKSNVIDARYNLDESKKYKTIILYSQNENDTNYDLKKTFTDSTAKIDKTLVLNVDKNIDLDRYGRQLIELQNFNAENFDFTLSSMTQNGILFDINKFCHISDDAMNIRGDYIIYGLDFNLTENSSRVNLKIGKRGMPS